MQSNSLTMEGRRMRRSKLAVRVHSFREKSNRNELIQAGDGILSC